MSIYDHLKKCIGKSADTIFGKLDEINITLFAPLYQGSGEIQWGDEKKCYTHNEAALIIMYLIFAYSAESEFLILGMDVQEERYGIAHRVGLPEELHKDVISLISPLVRKVMMSYIDKQANRSFKYLSFKKDMYEAALNQSLQSLTDNNGNIDIQKMSDNDKYLNKLLVELKECEDQVRAEYNYYYENAEEVNTISKRRNDTGNIEHSNEIG